MLDAYLTAMADGDAQGAYALGSARYRQEYSVEDLEEQLQSYDYTLYSGYRSVKVDTCDPARSWRVFNPLARVASVEVSGTVAYEEGYRGTIQAALDLEADGWKVTWVYIVVPPCKFGDDGGARPPRQEPDPVDWAPMGG